MFNLIICTISIIGIGTTLKFILEYKEMSLKNKVLFIDEYRESELNKHPYTVKNYKDVKKWAEKQYPIMNYINKQDLQYSQTLFQEDNTSIKYKIALLGKYDVAKIKKEIEFDALRECFIQICKSDKDCRTRTFLNRNKNLIYLFTQNIIFTKKIANSFKIIKFLILALLISFTLLLFF